MENLLKVEGHLKKLFFIFFFLFTTVLVPVQLYAQATTVNPFNQDAGTPPEFLGWDDTVNSDLQIRHNEPGQPIIFRIAGNEYMRYTEDGSLAVNTCSAGFATLRHLCPC
ncbi:MAG: hypothetical protein WBG42_07795 [Cryomorphaceae bacterium]